MKTIIKQSIAVMTMIIATHAYSQETSLVTSEDNTNETKKWNSVYITDHALKLAGHDLDCDKQDKDTHNAPSCARRELAEKTGKGTHRESINLDGIEIQATKMVVHADGSASFF